MYIAAEPVFVRNALLSLLAIPLPCQFLRVYKLQHRILACPRVNSLCLSASTEFTWNLRTNSYRSSQHTHQNDIINEYHPDHRSHLWTRRCICPALPRPRQESHHHRSPSRPSCSIAEGAPRSRDAPGKCIFATHSILPHTYPTG